jgi:putative phosphoesterase
MRRIGLLSDTHGFLDEQILSNLEECDEIWHAGDIGTIELLDLVPQHLTRRVVYGNIDGGSLRIEYKKDLLWKCEDLKIFMTHIGGYPGRYNARVKEILKKEKPHLYICGHSHILKIMKDKNLDIIHINPGACGHHGFHKIRTMVRFTIEKDKIFDVEVIELGMRGKL